MPSSGLQSRTAAVLNGSTRRTMFAFEEAATMLDLEPWIVQRLRYPIEERTAYLQLRRDSGETLCAPLFSVHHSELSGRTIGGLCLLPDLQLRDCEAMAMERTWQSALLGLHFGGASFGVVCDPAEMSEEEMVALARPLARQLDKGVSDLLLAPDRGCVREFMARVFAGMRGDRHLHVTGKPDCMGGLDPDEFITEGIAALVSSCLRHSGKGCIGAKVAIQGFAGRGQAISGRLKREGMQIVAITDNSGGIYRSDGLILEDVRTTISRDHVLFAYGGAERINRADLLQVDADVLVLTSGAKELREEHGKSVSADLIVEASWDAVEDGAREPLAARRRTVAPWFVATCGSVMAAYFEGLYGEIPAAREELLANCHGKVARVTEDVLRQADAQQTSFEQAAYRVAIDAAASYLRCCGYEG